MGKKIIINEETFKNLVKNDILMESGMSDAELNSKVKSAVSDAIKHDRELEKKVKKIVADSVDTLFKTLWQRSNFYSSEILK